MTARVLRARAVANGAKGGIRCPVVCRYSGVPCARYCSAETPACGVHLGREGRAAAAMLRAYAAQYVARWEPRLSPACWHWPLPARPATLQEWQAGRCAICGTAASFDLVVDHDHGTGLVRGLLCRPCNMTESRRDVTDGRFTNYRYRPAAALIGLRIPYRNT